MERLPGRGWNYPRNPAQDEHGPHRWMHQLRDASRRDYRQAVTSAMSQPSPQRSIENPLPLSSTNQTPYPGRAKLRAIRVPAVANAMAARSS